LSVERLAICLMKKLVKILGEEEEKVENILIDAWTPTGHWFIPATNYREMANEFFNYRFQSS